MATGVIAGLTSVFTSEGAALGVARSYTLTVNQALIDGTSDDDSRWDYALVGRRDWSIDIECLYLATDTTQIYIEEHLISANPAVLTVIFTLPGGRTYSGTCLATSYNISSNFEDAVSMSISLKGRGALTGSAS